jgi:hypothetical protein
MIFDGIRYSEALAAAAEHAFPNFYPYRFQSGEPNPIGCGKATIPYLLTTGGGVSMRYAFMQIECDIDRGLN